MTAPRAPSSDATGTTPAPRSPRRADAPLISSTWTRRSSISAGLLRRSGPGPPRAESRARAAAPHSRPSSHQNRLQIAASATHPPGVSSSRRPPPRPGLVQRPGELARGRWSCADRAGAPPGTMISRTGAAGPDRPLAHRRARAADLDAVHPVGATLRRRQLARERDAQRLAARRQPPQVEIPERRRLRSGCARLDQAGGVMSHRSGHRRRHAERALRSAP